MRCQSHLHPSRSPQVLKGHGFSRAAEHAVKNELAVAAEVRSLIIVRYGLCFCLPHPRHMPRSNVHKQLLISFSGMDGCGKSTQIENLRRSLSDRGLTVKVLAFWDDVVVLTRFREGFVHKVYRQRTRHRLSRSPGPTARQECPQVVPQPSAPRTVSA